MFLQQEINRKDGGCEFNELVGLGIQEFHNGRTRHRFVVGRGLHGTGAQRKNSINACWVYVFAQRCNGYVKDGKRYIKDGYGGYLELED